MRGLQHCSSFDCSPAAARDCATCAGAEGAADARAPPKTPHPPSHRRGPDCAPALLPPGIRRLLAENCTLQSSATHPDCSNYRHTLLRHPEFFGSFHAEGATSPRGVGAARGARPSPCPWKYAPHSDVTSFTPPGRQVGRHWCVVGPEGSGRERRRSDVWGRACRSRSSALPGALRGSMPGEQTRSPAMKGRPRGTAAPLATPAGQAAGHGYRFEAGGGVQAKHAACAVRPGSLGLRTAGPPHRPGRGWSRLQSNGLGALPTRLES